ncbi:DUF1015 domain-containing protein [Zhouia amylolytica]|uniref:DUF1015 domain-containing protein n=1 Tax=Zhouia amylolytica TaxID=376730 RepID=UPI0020CFD13D|nr:DUF1015 domain-containing protein [Zhouia amylolytica]MCQ0110821.1 DUF1015 domain-containing protein [Zhouia amylolytica]
MAKIIPFKAVRPSRDKVGLVASRSYEDYSRKELKAQLRFNPFSFLHIINPGYKFQHEVSGVERFKLVRNRYLEFKEDDTFIKDEIPSFYIYQLNTRDHSFCGVFAGASIEDYDNNIIKKHEDTIERREVLFKDYLKTVGFNAEPVLLTYPDNDNIALVIKKTTSQRPEYEFATPDKSVHRFWLINKKDDVETIQREFKKIKTLYIADGHHRSASSSLLAKELRSEDNNQTGNEAYNYFLSYMIPESELRISDFNRMIKDLNGLTKEEFLIKLDEFYRIENRGEELYQPTKKHHFSMYLDDDFYSLYLRKSVYNFSDALSTLDTQILYKTILEPILGISDLRNNKRISYGYGNQHSLKMKDLIDKGKFKVGFSMLPVTIDEMKLIAEEGLKMPPKSTYIEPKLRSGLTIYEF